jgi:hypothetical protein
MHAPRFPHMQAATRVLRYIKGSPGQGILFPSSNTLHVTASIQIGPAVLLLVAPPPAISFNLARVLFHGAPRNK